MDGLAPSPAAASREGQPQPLINRTGDFGGGIFRRALLHLTAGNAVAVYGLLSLLCLAAFGIGLAAVPPTDRDESRFMQASKQMIESGDYVHIRVQSEPRRKKPIGIHWLQVVAVKALDQPLNTAWPYRIPSLLGAWAAVLLVCAMGRHLMSARAGLIAGAVLATCPMVIAEAHLAKTDAVLLCFVTLAMAALAKLYVPDGETKRWPAAIFWIAIGAAILIKGPVVLMVVGAAVATLCAVDQNISLLRALQPAWGIPLALLVIAPWLLTLVASGEGAFIATAVKQDLLPKLMGGQESHGLPPGSHLIAALITTWPWSLIVPVAFIAVWPQRETPSIRFCLAWLVPGWLLFEAIPTKLPHYVLPLLPALALLVGAALDDPSRVQRLLRQAGGVLWRGVWGVVTVGFGIGILWLALHDGTDGGLAANPWAIAAAATLGIAAVAAVLGADRIGSGPVMAAVVVAALWFNGVMMDRTLPGLDRLWVSQRLAAAVARHPTTAPVTLVGFHEPSAVFLLGTATHLTDAAGAVTDLFSQPNVLVAVDAPSLATVTAGVEIAGYKVVPLETIDGQNYARGAAVKLTLLTIAKP